MYLGALWFQGSLVIIYLIPASVLLQFVAQLVLDVLGLADYLIVQFGGNHFRVEKVRDVWLLGKRVSRSA